MAGEIDWEQRYATDDSEYDWYISAEECCDIVENLAKPDEEIIYLGCGTSAVGSELYKRGKRFITNVDQSPEVIQVMNTRCSTMTDMQFVEMDVTRLPKDLTGVFQLALDKGLLDSLLCNNAKSKAERYLTEVKRIIKPGGFFCCISHGIPETRTQFLSQIFAVPSKAITVKLMPKPRVGGLDIGASPNYFVYIIKIVSQSSTW